MDLVIGFDGIGQISLGGFSGFGHWVGSMDSVIGWYQWIWSLGGLMFSGFGHWVGSMDLI